MQTGGPAGYKKITLDTGCLTCKGRFSIRGLKQNLNIQGDKAYNFTVSFLNDSPPELRFLISSHGQHHQVTEYFDAVGEAQAEFVLTPLEVQQSLIEETSEAEESEESEENQVLMFPEVQDDLYPGAAPLKSFTLETATFSAAVSILQVAPRSFAWSYEYRAGKLQGSEPFRKSARAANPKAAFQTAARSLNDHIGVLFQVGGLNKTATAQLEEIQGWAIKMLLDDFDPNAD